MMQQPRGSTRRTAQDDFRPGTRVRLAGEQRSGVTATSDDYLDTLQLRGVHRADQVLVHWMQGWVGEPERYSWERRDALEIEPGHTAEIPAVKP
jgi:hypothetical protein